METVKADFENWHMECLPEDGNKIKVMGYADQQLQKSIYRGYLLRSWNRKNT